MLHSVAASTELLVNRNVNPDVVLYYIELFCNVIILIDTRQNTSYLFWGIISAGHLYPCILTVHQRPTGKHMSGSKTSQSGR